MFLIEKVSRLSTRDNSENNSRSWISYLKSLFLPLIILNSLIIGQQIERRFTKSLRGNVETPVKVHRSLLSGHFDDQHVDDTNLDDLWLGRVSEERIKHERTKNKKPKVSLAVSHCDLPVDWIWNYFLQVGIKFESAHIYSKCDEPVKGAPPEATIVKLPNVGRNDHSFAYHMNHLDYTNRSDDEIVFFMKDNLYRLIEHDLFFNDTEKRSMSTLIDYTSVNGFGCLEQPRSLLNIYPSFYYDLETLNTYNFKGGYARLERDEIPSSVPFASKYESFKEWIESLNVSLPTPFTPVCMGGMFSTTVAQIRKRKSVWGAMEKKLSRGNNIEEGHLAERSWAGLLSKPLSSKAVEKIKNKMTDIMCYIYPWGHRCGTIAFTVNGTEPLEVDYYDDDSTSGSSDEANEISER